MNSNKEGSDPFENLSEEQLSELVKANDALDQEEVRILNEEMAEEEKISRPSQHIIVRK